MIHPVPGRALGKHPPVIDPRTFQLRKYLKLSFLPAAVSVDWTKASDVWPMLLNDKLGDCVVAGALHLIQFWSAMTGNPITPVDGDAEKIYEIFGYNPQDPQDTDNGIAMLPFLKYWRKTGLPVGGKLHKITGFAQVNTTSVAEVSQTIDLFGGLYLGANLPNTAQDGTVWSVPNGLTGDGAPGSWGGHCIPVLADRLNAKYPLGLKQITWGQVYEMTWYFLQMYGDEGYAVFAPEWINAYTGLSPSNFDGQQLLADLAAL
jgi:hypothetical protein